MQCCSEQLPVEEKQDRISEAEYLISMGQGHTRTHSMQLQTTAAPMDTNRSADAGTATSSKGPPPPGFSPLQGGLVGGADSLQNPRISQPTLVDTGKDSSIA